MLKYRFINGEETYLTVEIGETGVNILYILSTHVGIMTDMREVETF
jgi:hypothetical protein